MPRKRTPLIIAITHTYLKCLMVSTYEEALVRFQYVDRRKKNVFGLFYLRWK